MALKITIKTKGLVPGISRSQAQQLVRETLKGIGAGWHRRFLPMHFTMAGARRYGYQKRKTKSITKGKLRTRGRGGSIDPRPLVKTGTLMGDSLALPTITSTFRRATVKLPVGYINRYKPNGFASGQLRFELTRILPQEEVALAKAAEQELRARFTKSKKNINVSTFRR